MCRKDWGGDTYIIDYNINMAPHHMQKLTFSTDCIIKNNCVIINHTINRQSCYGFDVKKGIYSCSLFGASFLRCEIFLCNLVPKFWGV